MFLSQEEAERRLNSPENLLNKLAPAESNKGKNDEPRGKQDPTYKPADTEKSSETGQLIREFPTIRGRPSDHEERAREAALRLAAKSDRTGAVGYYISGNEQIIKRASPDSLAFQKAAERLEEVRDIALEKLILAVNNMTEDKFKKADLKDLSTVAVNLGRVVEKASPSESIRAGEQTNIVIYAPQLADESRFKAQEIEVLPVS